MIVNMYGLPSYDEIDPTPFIAISFCLAFGIMFGDIGHGFIIFFAALWMILSERKLAKMDLGEVSD